MRTLTTVLLTVTCIVTVAWVAALPALGEDEPGYSYVGTKKCKKCHIKEHRSWKKTRMALTFDTLEPGNAAEVKTKFKIDVSKDFTQDASCLECHTTGPGKPGGYVVPDPEDKKAVNKAKKFRGVGCESCHGPGSEYVKVFEEILESKRKYKVEELYAVGLVKIDESTCKTCHNERSPTRDPEVVFDYETQKELGIHEIFPLKQREE